MWRRMPQRRGFATAAVSAMAGVKNVISVSSSLMLVRERSSQWKEVLVCCFFWLLSLLSDREEVVLCATFCEAQAARNRAGSSIITSVDLLHSVAKFFNIFSEGFDFKFERCDNVVHQDVRSLPHIVQFVSSVGRQLAVYFSAQGVNLRAVAAALRHIAQPCAHRGSDGGHNGREDERCECFGHSDELKDYSPISRNHVPTSNEGQAFARFRSRWPMMATVGCWRWKVRT
nr:MAG TPA: hypothetical protein [Caudoviricetes sp.]